MIPAQSQFCCLRCKAAVHCCLFIFKGVAYQINENAHAAGGLILSPEDADSGVKQTTGTVPGGTCRPQERMILTHHFVLRGIRF
uniref:Uncharacterized protein n=1 Tax=Oryza meridionalis TaxID=40149 RepID=A0A0E0EV27_9ORYZ